MKQQLDSAAAYLRSRHEAIITQWLLVCDADDQLPIAERLTRAEFRNNIPAALDGLCQFLVSAGDDLSSSTRVEVAKHGHHRWKQGFSLRELIRDWGHLNRVLVRTLQEFFRASGGTPAAEAEALDRLAQFMTEACGSSVRRFDDLRKAEAAGLAKDLAHAKSAFEEFVLVRGKLLREVAHDMRGGLSSIAGATSVLKLSESNESLSELIEALDEGVDGISDLLDSLLDLSRLESGADEALLLTVDMAAVLEKIASQYRATAEQKGLRLLATGPGEMTVETDPEKVRRIVQNLLVNAIQYTSSGVVHLSWQRERDRWVVQVEDTGPGVQERLGAPVAQEMTPQDRARPPDLADADVAYQGEGIGLTIVRRLCTLLDAGISLQSELGQGSCFTVEFPLEVRPEGPRGQ